MLRIVGAVFIIMGSTGVGLCYKGRFHTALWHLRYMYQILELIMSEIRYGKSTLPECCKHIASKVSEPYSAALIGIWEAMESHVGTGFAENWRVQMEKALLDVPVTKREKEMFLGFSSCCGLSDNQMQVRAIEQYRDMLANSIKMRENELEKQSKMAAGLGIMCGLLITVILL